MIRIACDCCHKLVPRDEGYIKCDITVHGTRRAANRIIHLCEGCYIKLSRAAEVVKNDASTHPTLDAVEMACGRARIQPALDLGGATA